MKLKNQINKKQRKKDIIVVSVFLALSILGMFTFFLIEFFMWTFNIYFTPHFFVACIHLLLCAFFLFGLVIILKPFIRIDGKALLISDTFHIRKKIMLSSVKKITAESNQVILDGKYKSEAMIVDVFYINESARFALNENDYITFANNYLITEKLNK